MILIQPRLKCLFSYYLSSSPLQAPDQAYHLWKLSLHCPSPNRGGGPTEFSSNNLYRYFYHSTTTLRIINCSLHILILLNRLKMNHFRLGHVLSALLFLVLSTVLGTEWLCSKCWWKESFECLCATLKQMCSWHMGDTFCLCDNWQLSLLGSKSTQLKTKHSCLSLLHFLLSI